MNVEVFEDLDDTQQSSMMCDDTTNRKSPSTKMLTITTPDIINGQIKSIKVKNEKYHDVNLKFI
jgi:hypothetical protein